MPNLHPSAKAESDIARTVDDVKRLAPTAGFYWFRRDEFTSPWDIAELVISDIGARRWFVMADDQQLDDEGCVGDRIIGPITPPEAP